MVKEKSLSDYIAFILSAKGTFWEREPSTRLYSAREMRTKFPERIHHRFPIKNGVTFRDLIHDNMAKNNALYARLKSKQK